MTPLRASKAAASTALLSLLAACASPGSRLEPSDLAPVQEGKSTRADVEKVFGAPREQMVGPNGLTVVIYTAGESLLLPRLGGMDLEYRRKMISFLYGPSGVVLRKLRSDSTGRLTGRESQRMAAGSAFSKDDLARVIQPGIDSSTLEQILGPCSGHILAVTGGSIISWFSMSQTPGSVFSAKAEFERQVVSVLLSPAGKVVSYSISGNLEGEKLNLPSPTKRPARQML